MPDYSRAMIYKIVSKNPNILDSYVGSTTSFRARRSLHKKTTTNRCCRNYNNRLYKFIRNNGGWAAFDMILIEMYDCNSKLELLARERHHYDQLKPTLNSNVPNRSKKEYHEINKEKTNRYTKQYRQEKKELIKLTHFRNIKCEYCGVLHTKANQTNHRKTKFHKRGIENHILNKLNNLLDGIDDKITRDFNQICAKIDAIKTK